MLALQNQQDAEDEQRHANVSGRPSDDGIAEGIAKDRNRHKYNRPTEHKVPARPALRCSPVCGPIADPVMLNAAVTLLSSGRIFIPDFR
jgi:hypothetical protein